MDTVNIPNSFVSNRKQWILCKHCVPPFLLIMVNNGYCVSNCIPLFLFLIVNNGYYNEHCVPPFLLLNVNNGYYIMYIVFLIVNNDCCVNIVPTIVSTSFCSYIVNNEYCVSIACVPPFLFLRVNNRYCMSNCVAQFLFLIVNNGCYNEH